MRTWVEVILQFEKSGFSLKDISEAIISSPDRLLKRPVLSKLFLITSLIFLDWSDSSLDFESKSSKAYGIGSMFPCVMSILTSEKAIFP